jgi:hypothetical protein
MRGERSVDAQVHARCGPFASVLVQTAACRRVQ